MELSPPRHDLVVARVVLRLEGEELDAVGVEVAEQRSDLGRARGAIPREDRAWAHGEAVVREGRAGEDEEVIREVRADLERCRGVQARVFAVLDGQSRC